MKVGILTFHNNENKGAILQCWCLSKLADEMVSDWDVDVISYQTLSKEISRVRPFILTKRPKEIPTKIRDWRQCKEFVQNYLPLSEERILTDDYKKAESQLESLNYDLLIVGSDEVWKVHEPNAGTPIIRPKRPFPNLYLPGPNVSAIKTSYAASANTLELDKLSSNQRAILQRNLQDFDLISVRDQHTEHVLSELGVNDVYHVADPTLLQDIPERDIVPILQNSSIDLNSPMIGIHGLRDKKFDPICNWFRNQGYQIISPTISPHADVNLKSKLDPFEYYSLYGHFDFILTSSLHSTIFSIKQRTPFITIDTSAVYKRTESKTESLLRDFDLLHRHYDMVNGEEESLMRVIQRCNTPLNEETVSQSMSDLQSQSKVYLSEIYEIGTM